MPERDRSPASDLNRGSGRDPASRPSVGDEVELELTGVAHGGFMVARLGGYVVFVRDAVLGERVRAVITDVRKSYSRARAIEVLTPSTHRIVPACPHAGSGPKSCGGCDFQHVDLGFQRELKARVVREQFQRLARLDVEVSVEPVPGGAAGGLDAGVGATPAGLDARDGLEAADVATGAGLDAGLGWRTRAEWTVDEAGRAGFHPWHSHEVAVIDECLLLHPGLRDLGVTHRRWAPGSSVRAAHSSAGSTWISAAPRPGGLVDAPLPDDVAVAGVRGRTWVTEHAAGREWRVPGAGFWQVYPGAADALVAAVREAAGAALGSTDVGGARARLAWDLYAGVGLFAGALATAGGPGGTPGVEAGPGGQPLGGNTAEGGAHPGGQPLGGTPGGEAGPGGRPLADVVHAVEFDDAAVRASRRNLNDVPGVRIHGGDVKQWLRAAEAERLTDADDPDLVVLDPPRTGAGLEVMGLIADRHPRAIVYVACDPAALARDAAALVARGYELVSLRGFDLFPMTHHVECVAAFRAGSRVSPEPS